MAINIISILMALLAAAAPSVSDCDIAPTTEILSLEDPEAAHEQSNNIFPTPLLQGSYDVFLVDKDGDMKEVSGKLYYSAPTHSIFIVIPAMGVNTKWSDLRVAQMTANENVKANYLAFTNGSNILVLFDTEEEGIFCVGTQIDGASYALLARRSSYKYLSPGTISATLRNLH